MKRTNYIIDSFIDYTGKERKFIIAAVSMQDETYITIDEDYETLPNTNKVLSLGISVCRPDDVFDTASGKQIAEGKAIKYRNHAIYTTDTGLINESVVDAILKQEAAYFKTNPGSYLAGYDKDAEKYRNSERIESFIENLNEDGQTVLNYLTNASDEEMDNMIEAANYVLA